MGSGSKGLYSGTYGSNAIPGSAYFMDPNEDFIRFIKRRKDIDSNGFVDVVAHGETGKIYIKSGGKQFTVNHREAAKLFRTKPELRGKPLRLLSCDTGGEANGFAQNLANKLNVVVEAPTKLVWAYPNGHYIVAARRKDNPHKPDLSRRGKFIKFYPGGKKK